MTCVFCLVTMVCCAFGQIAGPWMTASFSIGKIKILQSFDIVCVWVSVQYIEGFKLVQRRGFQVCPVVISQY